MKKLLPILIILFILTGCGPKEADNRKLDISFPEEENPIGEDVKLEENTINITIANITYTASLYENEVSQQFLDHLPLTLEMTELNGNEKYGTLDFTLTNLNEDIKTIHAGDIMLYGDNTLVLFYKDFETTYTYTPIAHIQEPTGLAEHVGSGNITMVIN